LSRPTPWQRTQILDAVVQVVGERGARNTSVERVVERAGVSRRTFYQQFSSLEECLVAVVEDAGARAVALAARAFEEERHRPWQDGMRAALAAVLGMFDAQPDLARVCMVEAFAAGSLVREHREGISTVFRELVVARIEDQVTHPSSLAPEGTLASVMGIVSTRIVEREQAPLIEMIGPLMGVIVGPFMDGAGVAREIEKGHALTREILAERTLRGTAAGLEGGDAAIVPIGLRDPRAHRARLCLLYVVEHPCSSNSEVGAAVGVTHSGHVARLLGKLASGGLLVKRAGNPGRPNSWSATPIGERVARALRQQHWAGGHSVANKAPRGSAI
jgi:AcrR family transcriptional regulator